MRLSHSVVGTCRHLIRVALLAAVAVVPTAGKAVLPSPETARYEVDRRGEEAAWGRRPGDPGLQAALSRSPAFNEFILRHPGWVARWDVASRVPERLQGPPQAVPGFGAVDSVNAADAVRAFLQAEMAAWIPVEDLVEARTIGDRGGFWVHFQQIHEGVPVWDSRLTARLSRHGRVTLVSNHTFLGLPAGYAFRTTPAEAVEAAREGLPGAPAPLGDPALTYLPIRRSEHYELRATWRLEFRTVEVPGVWVSFVDAADGTLVWRFNRIQFGEVHGQVQGSVEPITADEEFEDRPFPHLNVLCSAPEADSVDTVTAADGTFSLEIGAGTGRTAAASLSGPFGVVYDVRTGQVASISQPVPDGESAQVDFYFGESEAQVAERDAYLNVMVAHDHIQTIDPGFDLLDYPMPIYVNVPGRCNAFWDGVGISFYEAGGRCVNVARIADVAYHEYGHGITDFLTRPFSLSGAMAEGFSDYYAATISGQPVLGRGFYGPGTSLRRIDDDFVYPEDWIGESHHDGLIIGSALWDLRETLGAPRADSLFHFARLGFADNFDDYFFALLTYDDDNDDVYDGTPNLDAICGIFRAHGIGDYGIHVSHTPFSDTEDTLRTLPLTASFLSVFALDPEQVRVHATLTRGEDVTFIDSTMAPTGLSSREYTTVLQPQPAGTIVRYYFTAADTSGTTVTWPEAGEADPCVFVVGADVTAPVIAHDPLPDQPIDIDAIRARAAVRDNLDQPLRAVTLTQQHNENPPIVGSMAALGGHDYLAELSTLGLALGDSVRYQIEAEDGAAVPNAATDPASGWHSFRIVRGFERDFEADDGGVQGDNDWEWGHSTVVEAVSGQNLWATSLDGPYQHMTRSTLSLEPVDLTEFASAALVFRHYLSCEEAYDGGFVEVSIDGGVTWTLARPAGDYPAHVLAAQGSPGYSGETGGWETAQFDLFPYLGQADVRIRLVFSSDQGVTGLGWYLDDLSVVERQVAGAPQRLQARDGIGTTVALRWAQPAGLSAVGATPVTGYNVYRSAGFGDSFIDGGGRSAGRAERSAGADRLAGQDDALTLLNAEPLTARQYRDTTAVIGESYRYYVSALYGSAESPLAGPVAATAYLATYAADFTAITVSIDSSGVVDTTLAIRNTGTGVLEANAFLADTAQTVDDMRIAIRLDSDGAPGANRAAGDRKLRSLPVPAGSASDSGPRLAELLRGLASPRPKAQPAVVPGGSRRWPSDWDTLATDPNDPPEADPDLASLAKRLVADTLYLSVSAHESMLSLYAASTLVVAMNTDRQSPGVDFLVLAGAQAMQYFGAVVVLLDGDLNPASGLLAFDLHDDRITLGLDLAELGQPWRIDLLVHATAGPGPGESDSMPDGFDAVWIDSDPAHLSVAAGTEGELTLEFNSETLPAGDHHAKLILETNDLARPIIEIPITFAVRTVTPIQVSGLMATAGDQGVILSWRTPPDLDYAGFEVYRRQVLPVTEEEFAITSELLVPSWNGEYRFVDANVLPGREYEYRVVGVERNGERESFGPITVTTPGAEPPQSLRLSPCIPNPALRGTLIRYGVPDRDVVRLAIYAPDGRLVRTVLNRDRREAGWYVENWDGRDDRGRRVGAGLYLIRLESTRQRRSEKILLLR